MDKKWLARLLISLVTLVPVVQAEGLFPEYIDSRNAKLSRCSRAELKAFRIIHVGNAALYLDDCKKTSAIFSPKTGLQLNLNNKPLAALNDPAQTKYS